MPRRKIKVWPAREKGEKIGSRQGRAMLGMRESPLANYPKGPQLGQFPGTPDSPQPRRAPQGWGVASALSHPTMLGRPHLRRRSSFQHDLALLRGICCPPARSSVASATLSQLRPNETRAAGRCHRKDAAQRQPQRCRRGRHGVRRPVRPPRWPHVSNRRARRPLEQCWRRHDQFTRKCIVLSEP